MPESALSRETRSEHADVLVRGAARRHAELLLEGGRGIASGGVRLLEDTQRLHSGCVGSLPGQTGV